MILPRPNVQYAVGSGGAFKLVLMIVTQVAKHHRVELPGQLLAFEGLAL